jgi:hypothetical protein
MKRKPVVLIGVDRRGAGRDDGAHWRRCHAGRTANGQCGSGRITRDTPVIQIGTSHETSAVLIR